MHFDLPVLNSAVVNICKRTACSRAPPESLEYPQLHKFPAFYGIRRLLPHLQEPATCLLSQTKPAHALPSHFKIHFNIILSSTPGSSKHLHFSSFPTKTPYVSLLFSIRATRPTLFILVDLITRIIFGEEYRV